MSRDALLVIHIPLLHFRLFYILAIISTFPNTTLLLEIAIIATFPNATLPPGYVDFVSPSYADFVCLIARLIYLSFNHP